MQELRSVPSPGRDVRIRQQRWHLTAVRAFERCALVTIDGRDQANAGDRLTLLAPPDRIVAPSHARLPRRTRDALTFGLLDAIGRARHPGTLWAAAGARFALHAWQLAPALAIVNGATRVLLADGVGLGKTIQAGLILAELLARGLVERALILTPAGLRTSWRDELGRWMGITATVMDQAALAVLAHDAERGANPWGGATVMVSSIDLVKRPEVRAAVEREPVDLLIVDEAHHATPSSDRGRLVARLARRAPWVVLASATPHTGDAAAFRWLLDLGATRTGDQPMRVFRRSREHTGLRVHRRTCVLLVRPHSDEAQLLDALVAYARDLARSGAAEGSLSLLATVLARRATSSAYALRRTLARRLEALSASTAGATTPAAQPALPWEELDDNDDGRVAGLGWRALAGGDEVARLRDLVALADRAAVNPSKFARLRRLLTRTTEPAVVFTEFRDSLVACHHWLATGTSTVCVHGGMDVGERDRALGRFLGGEARILLATDVAGEGLNLQARARLVVTLEWPWSPQRLEQRIGRVDRIGQARRVHAVHLTARDTFEETVVARALARDARARSDLAAWSSSEAAVAEAARATTARQLIARARGSLRPGWCLPARGRQIGRVVVVFDGTTFGPTGRPLSRAPVAVEVTLARTPRDRRAWGRLCRQLTRDPRVRAAALTANGDDRERWDKAGDRVAALHHRIAGRAVAVQPSLFDTRAVDEATDHRRARQRAADRLRRLHTWIDADAGPGRVELRVVAVVPLRAASIDGAAIAEASCLRA